MTFLLIRVRVEFVTADFGVYVYRFCLIGRNFVIPFLVIVDMQCLVRYNMLEKIISLQ